MSHPRQTFLQDAYTEARKEIPRLGIEDLIAVRRGLADGLAKDRSQLVRLCQAIWAKSPAEQDSVKDIVESRLPTPIDGPTLAQLFAAAQRPPDSPPDPTGTVAGNPPITEIPTTPESGESEPQRRNAETPAPPAPVPFMEYGETSGQAKVAALPRVRLADSPHRTHYDLVGTLPVAPRAMRQAFRTLRRMGRSGLATELDIGATIARIVRIGRLDAPVMRPPRRNLNQFLVLVDTLGSMAPFHREIDALLDALPSAGFTGMVRRWFHDIPLGHVYKDAALREIEPLDACLEPFSGQPVLVISDAGAARGNTDPARARQSAAFFAKIKIKTPLAAWLNPVPQDRWSHSTAAALVRSGKIAMQPLDLAGLKRSIEILRGR